MSDRRLVVPIGHYAGQRPGERHQVRLGRRMEILGDEEFSLWLLSHGIPQAGRAEWTVDQVLELASTTVYDHVEHTWHGLCERGLIARVPLSAESPHAIEFARSHRVCALLTGVGDTPERPGRFAVGVPGTTAVAWLDADAFELWRWAAVAPSLWALAGRLDRSHLEGSDQLHALLSDLRILLAASCAYVDLADEPTVEHAQ